jgi:hypothetical protein
MFNPNFLFSKLEIQNPFDRFKSLALVVFYFSVLYFSCSSARAQNESDESTLMEMKDGLSFNRDSVFQINMRFRMQNRFGYLSMLDNTEEQGFEMRVRRLRFRIDGFLYNRKLSYYIQLSFSRGDLDIVAGEVPHILRDAMIYYHLNKNFYLGFGQSKLPGNRQRVVSSGNLQMPERSIANQLFNIDRDYGVFAYLNVPFGKPILRLKGALTSGEGRNAVFSNSGLAHTVRLEFLPFGKFENNGDYSEGDLEYEETVKIALASTYSYNQRAVRSGGQIGFTLDKPVDIHNIFLDMMIKYRGWALLAEYFDKRLNNINPESSLIHSVYHGYGLNLQLSKTFQSKYEVGMRYAAAYSRNSQLSNFNTRGIGFGRYLNGHRVKFQTFIGLDNRSESSTNFRLHNRINAQIQIEFGI